VQITRGEPRMLSPARRAPRADIETLMAGAKKR